MPMLQETFVQAHKGGKLVLVKIDALHGGTIAQAADKAWQHADEMEMIRTRKQQSRMNEQQ